MEFLSFLLNLAVAVVLGVMIGLERQWRQHPAGLRTNALVCVGAALFVSISELMGDPGSPTRVASYIVSGIGFLGGGVILKEGTNVKGMNTAATIWCSGAVGTLAGAGFPAHAAAGAVVVLGVHLGLRPLAHWVDAKRKASPDVDFLYRIRVVCEEGRESLIRTILMRHIDSHPKMNVHGITTAEGDQPGRAVVVAEAFSSGREDKAVQEVVSRLHIEPSVSSISWEKETR